MEAGLPTPFGGSHKADASQAHPWESSTGQQGYVKNRSGNEALLCLRRNERLSEFYRNRARRDGLDTYCAECKRRMFAEFRRDFPKRHRLPGIPDFRYRTRMPIAGAGYGSRPHYPPRGPPNGGVLQVRITTHSGKNGEAALPVSGGPAFMCQHHNR